MTTELTVTNAAGKLNVHNKSPSNSKNRRKKKGGLVTKHMNDTQFDFSLQGNMDFPSAWNIQAPRLAS